MLYPVKLRFFLFFIDPLNPFIHLQQKSEYVQQIIYANLPPC